MGEGVQKQGGGTIQERMQKNTKKEHQTSMMKYEARNMKGQEGQQEQQGIDATAELESKVEDLLLERQWLEGKIARKECMIEDKQARLGAISKWERERWESRTEVSGWEEEIRELRSKLSELDKKRDSQERNIKATKEGRAEANFVADIKRCAAEMQEGRWMEEEGRAILRRAEAEMVEICKR